MTLSKTRKNEEASCFRKLDVLSGKLEAFLNMEVRIEKNHCEESPTLARASKSSLTMKNLLPWLGPQRAASL
jgi:hypothetical protein